MNDDELILRRKKQNADRARAYRKRKKDLDAMPSTSTVQSGEPVSENIVTAKLLHQKQLNAERCRRYRHKCKRLKSDANFNQGTSDFLKMPLSNAEICKNYRNRKNLSAPPKTKTNAERCRRYRLRKKLAQDSKLSANEVLNTSSTSSSQPLTTDQKEETTKSSKDWEELCEVVYGKARWQSFSEEEKAEKKILVIEKYLPLQAGQSEHKQDSESEAGPSSAKCSRFDDDSSLNSLISGHDADDIPLDSPSYVTVKNITKLSDNTYVSQPIKTEEILIKEEPIDESMQEECLNNTLPPITLPQTTIPDQIMLASLPANNQQNVVLFNTISSPPPLCFTQNTYSKAKNVSSLVTKTIQGTSSDIQSTKSIHKPLEQLLTHLFPNETASMKDQLVIDEDVLFILSLISSIKKISESNRLAVKADFLNVLKKYQNN